MVLPTHDRPERLAGALSSVVNQTYSHLEIVVVDDASSTGARAVVERVAGDDTRVALLELPERVGAAVARNIGIDRCSGEFVAFLDDDDLWEPDKVWRQVAFLEEHRDVGLVTCDYTVVDETRPGGTALYRGPATFTAEQVQWMNFPGSFSFVMVRRSLVGAALCLDPAFSSVEDWDLWLRCLRHAPAGVVSASLCRHVAHAGPRLSHPESERAGHELFLRKHGGAMPGVCRSYLGAHLRMYEGARWSHRAAVARSLLTGSPPRLGHPRHRAGSASGGPGDT